jgi:hypothetical protein
MRSGLAVVPAARVSRHRPIQRTGFALPPRVTTGPPTAKCSPGGRIAAPSAKLAASTSRVNSPGAQCHRRHGHVRPEDVVENQDHELRVLKLQIAPANCVLAMKYDEACNKNDAAAVAALYTQDGAFGFSS